ncbi:MAG TPA: BON domain-containing protein [Candidatus Limnocylindrales bacterium]|nr:BON domain-containing protein [Candidatus Limnocylindrales bacterium]
MIPISQPRPSFLAGGLLLAGFLFMAAPVLAAPNDVWITTKVKLALISSDGIHANAIDAINVDTVNRQVTLHGSVRNAAEKEKAERVAKAVDGVRSVRNLLVVVPAAKQEQVQARDEAIARDVEMKLQHEDSLGDSNISIRSVHKGVVLLGGTARTLTDHLTAVQLAGSVEGVRRVASEIQSPDTLADADIWRERPRSAGSTGTAPAPGHVENKVAANAVRDPATGESINPNVNIDNTRATGSYGDADDPRENRAKVAALEKDDREEKRAAAALPDTETSSPGEIRNAKAGGAAGEAAASETGGTAPVSNEAAVRETARRGNDAARPSGAAADLYTTSMVKMRLLADDATPAMDINVDTRGGVVTLFGIVADEKEKAAAERQARQVDGVRDVKNELQVVASAKKEAVTARDDEIATNLQKSMGERVALKNVEVDVKNCVARLSGTVPSSIERLEAMQVARSTRGVCSVKNDLHVNN